MLLTITSRVIMIMMTIAMIMTFNQAWSGFNIDHLCHGGDNYGTDDNDDDDYGNDYDL